MTVEMEISCLFPHLDFSTASFSQWQNSSLMKPDLQI